MNANDERLVSPIDKPNNFKRIVTGFDITVSGANSPTIFAEILEYKPQETQFSL
jgi:hypothetical protein